MLALPDHGVKLALPDHGGKLALPDHGGKLALLFVAVCTFLCCSRFCLRCLALSVSVVSDRRCAGMVASVAHELSLGLKEFLEQHTGCTPE